MRSRVPGSAAAPGSDRAQRKMPCSWLRRSATAAAA
jgi:hypothetical protein